MSGAPFHFHEDALNLLIHGRKQWWLAPPAAASFSKEHPAAREVRLGLGAGAGAARPTPPHTCMQHAGEMLYVPRGWGHSAQNHGEAIGIAFEIDNANCSHPLATCWQRAV